jgi:hypothetical protein
MHMIRKAQMRDDGRALSPAQQFYALADVTPSQLLTQGKSARHFPSLTP